jgi:hypothetical protein
MRTRWRVLFKLFTYQAALFIGNLRMQYRIKWHPQPPLVSHCHRMFARSQALLGNVVLQAGACLVSSQSGDWELAYSFDKVLLSHLIQKVESED